MFPRYRGQTKLKGREESVDAGVAGNQKHSSEARAAGLPGKYLPGCGVPGPAGEELRLGCSLAYQQ